MGASSYSRESDAIPPRRSESRENSCTGSGPAMQLLQSRRAAEARTGTCTDSNGVSCTFVIALGCSRGRCLLGKAAPALCPPLGGTGNPATLFGHALACTSMDGRIGTCTPPCTGGSHAPCSCRSMHLRLQAGCETPGQPQPGLETTPDPRGPCWFASNRGNICGLLAKETFGGPVARGL